MEVCLTLTRQVEFMVRSWLSNTKFQVLGRRSRLQLKTLATSDTSHNATHGNSINAIQQFGKDFESGKIL